MLDAPAACCRRLWPTALLVVALVLGGGCLHLSQELSLATANTGTLRLQASLPETVYDEWLGQPESSILPGLAPFLEPAAARDWPPANAGLTITRHRAWRASGRFQVLLEAKVTDLQAAVKAGVLGPLKLEAAADGTRTLSWTPPATGLSAERVALWREPLREAQLSFTVTVPGTLLPSPGATVKGREAHWAFSGQDKLDWLSTVPTLSVRFRP